MHQTHPNCEPTAHRAGARHAALPVALVSLLALAGTASTVHADALAALDSRATAHAGFHAALQDPASASIRGAPQFSGVVNVGTGEAYTSLTNAGGLFEAINGSALGGDLVVQVTSNLDGETGDVSLEQFAEVGGGGYTLTIKPSGAERVIRGSSSTGLITLNGADRVVIDGALDGGSDRSLTIANVLNGTAAVVRIASGGAGNGASDNVIRNCIIRGAPVEQSGTTVGILSGGAILGGAAEAANNNNIVQNNAIFAVQNALYLRGGTAPADFDEGWQVLDNEMGSSIADDQNIFRGMLIGDARDFVIRGNHVHGISSTPTATAAMSGIQVAFRVDGGLIEANRIHDIHNNSVSGTGAAAINFTTTSEESNVLVVNNFVHDVAAPGSATLADNGMGIVVRDGGGYGIMHNSVHLGTAQASGVTAAMLVLSPVTGAGALDVRNNILANTQAAGATRYAIYSEAPASVFSSIDHNDYFSAGAVGFLDGEQSTLAEWQLATGQDADSLTVDPQFASATDLHLLPGSPMIGAAVPLAAVPTDIDGDARSPAAPDIGADEVTDALFKDGFE